MAAKRKRFSTTAIAGLGMTTVFLGAPLAEAAGLLPDRYEYFPNDGPQGQRYACMPIGSRGNALGQGFAPQISGYAQAIHRCAGGPGGYALARVYKEVTHGNGIYSSTQAGEPSEAVRTLQLKNGRDDCSLPTNDNHAAHSTQCLSRYKTKSQ